MLNCFPACSAAELGAAALYMSVRELQRGTMANIRRQLHRWLATTRGDCAALHARTRMLALPSPHTEAK
jgi:hypothetical protein